MLLPVVVKRWFPHRVGPMIGLYSMALSVGTSLAAAATVPLTAEMGGSWRAASGSGRCSPPRRWCCGRSSPCCAATAPAAGGRRRGGADGRGAVRADRPQPDGVGARRLPRPAGHQRLRHDGLAAEDLPGRRGLGRRLRRAAGRGHGGERAGLVRAAEPRRPARRPAAVRRGARNLRHRRYTGLAFAAGTASWLWACLVGLSMCAFPLALTMIGLRARTPGGVARLSAFSQCVGYLISIPGPIAVGAVYQATGSWYLPLGLLAALLVPQMVFGALVRPRHIEDELPRVPATA
ncbi:hypothetical protein ACFQ1I_32330 [Kitasatospora arboriphila]